MMKWVLMLLLLSGVAFGHSAHDEHDPLEQAEATINAAIPCDSLSDEQLEGIGEYMMDQMHSGDQVKMDMMIGGDEMALHDFHVRLARKNYCGENSWLIPIAVLIGVLAIIIIWWKLSK